MFRRWLGDAVAAGLPEPNAMVLSTVSDGGQPSSRMVLLKGLDEWGFHFFTNLLSRKGLELAGNPACSLLFPWHPLERQVRIEGVASQLLREDVATYFASRPRGAQLGAWASHQSSKLAGREEIEAAYAAAETRYPDSIDVPVPPRVGRLRRPPDPRRVLAGPSRPAARPARLPPRRGRRRLGRGAPGPVAVESRLRSVESRVRCTAAGP